MRASSVITGVGDARSSLRAYNLHFADIFEPVDKITINDVISQLNKRHTTRLHFCFWVTMLV